LMVRIWCQTFHSSSFNGRFPVMICILQTSGPKTTRD